MILTRRRPPPTHVSRNYFDERRQKEYFLECTNGHKYLFVAAWVGGSVSCFVRPGPTRPLFLVSTGPGLGNASNVGPGTGWGLSEGCVLLKRDLRRYKHFTTIVTCGPLAVPCITLSRQIATPGTLLLIKKLVILQLFPALAPTWSWCRVECGGAGSRSSEAVLPGSAQQTSLSCTQQSATLQSPDMGNVSSCQCCQCCQGESGARSWPGAGQERSRRPL